MIAVLNIWAFSVKANGKFIFRSRKISNITFEMVNVPVVVYVEKVLLLAQSCF